VKLKAQIKQMEKTAHKVVKDYEKYTSIWTTEKEKGKLWKIWKRSDIKWMMVKWVRLLQFIFLQ